MPQTAMPGRGGVDFTGADLVHKAHALPVRQDSCVQANRIDQPQLIVLAPGDTPQAAANARGHLFETFVATLLHTYGYEAPTKSNVNVTAEGIEIDVVTKHRLDNKIAYAECKAYGRPVKAAELTSFYGKLTVQRFSQPDALGLMIVSPRLTPEGEEQARRITEKDTNFLYIASDEIVSRLRQEKIVVDLPDPKRLVSDPATVLSMDGTYSAALELDPTSRSPTTVIVWSAVGSVPAPTIELLKEDAYAQGLPIRDLGASTAFGKNDVGLNQTADTQFLATVQGSKEDFQYQLPASPKFFVGRRDLLTTLNTKVTAGERTFVFNAQSGWGKSSLALKLANVVTGAGGHAVVMDTRTASSSRYVVEVLHRAATEAEAAGVVRLPVQPSWASLQSALSTYSAAQWAGSTSRLLIFFDQFENVFRSAELTRSFRDLCVGAAEIEIPLIIGFAWKTDLVGWTENHPYQLRDEIRSHAQLFVIEPFGSREVSTIIDRLERQAKARLGRDLRDRLREYSQGLPWLLKKLADHVLSELARGETQEQLVAEALNVQSLFDTDLAELTPNQREILTYVARYAPLAASEVTERYPFDAVQSLVDRRLIVQIGDRIDTYWDTFRDYVNTGRVPVEDSYILRQTPNAVARLLPSVMAAGGSASVAELSNALQTSDNVIFNLARELRLLGVATYEPLRVKISQGIAESDNPEHEFRAQVLRSLRRHRAFTVFRGLSARLDEVVTADQYARALPTAFPAVSVTDSTWLAYARVFLSWFEYAGLVVKRGGGTWTLRAELEPPPRQTLLTARSALRTRPSVPQEPYGPVRDMLLKLGAEGTIALDSATRSERDAIRTLCALGAAAVDGNGEAGLIVAGIVQEGEISSGVLRALLAQAPGGRAGLAVLASNPSASPTEVGEAIRAEIQARWTSLTVQGVGGYFRSWAKAAGVDVLPVRRN